MSASHNANGTPTTGTQVGGIANSAGGLGAQAMGGSNPYSAAANFGGGLIQGTVNPNHSGNSAGNIAGATLKGAGTGAAIGSIVPGIGTAIGAVGGGIIGALTTLF